MNHFPPMNLSFRRAYAPQGNMIGAWLMATDKPSPTAYQSKQRLPEHLCSTTMAPSSAHAPCASQRVYEGVTARLHRIDAVRPTLGENQLLQHRCHGPLTDSLH